MRGRADVDRLRPVGGRIEQPDRAAALIDDATAIGLRMAGVEVVVIGMAAQLAAVGSAGVEVADAFAIAEKPDPFAQPHRAGEVSGQLAHAPERARSLGVDPERAGGTAPVSLPARRIGGVAADHASLAGAEGEVVDLAPGKGARHAALGGDREGVMIAKEGLGLCRHEHDLASGRPPRTSVSAPSQVRRVATPPSAAMT